MSPARHGQRRWWPWLRRAGLLGFVAVVGTLLWTQAGGVDGPAVLAVLKALPAWSIGAAAALALASLALYSCFDLLGRRYTAHRLGTAVVMTVTFISYVFNLNLGALVGGVALRYRLYARLGLPAGVITRIVSLSLLTNWMGYLLLGGLVLMLQPPALPAGWPLGGVALRGLGVALTGIVAAYLAMCAWSPVRRFTVRGHTVGLPSARLAGLQLLLGAGNWLLMSAVIFVLLQQQAGFTRVLSALLLGGVAGVIAHIPAGLGVLEAVFVAMLTPDVPTPVVLAALVAYRGLYYLAPLAAAVVVYAATELRAKKLAAASARPAPPQPPSSRA